MCNVCKRTEELLARARRLDNFQHARADLLNCRNVSRQDTKVTRNCWHIYLCDLLGIVQSLLNKHMMLVMTIKIMTQLGSTYRVRQDKAQLELLAHSLSISTTRTSQLGKGWAVA